MLKPGQDPGEVEKLIYEEFERVKNDGVTPAEMQKILIQDRLQLTESHTNTLSRARAMGRDAVYFHDPNLINTVLSNYSEVTPADIQRVARQYLGATQRTVVLTNPKAQGAPAAQ
jgi:predicted Zn-dependent peptidase